MSHIVPVSKFEIIDDTAVKSSVIDNTVTVPLFQTVISSDKGVEGIKQVSGSLFYKMYGNVSFEKHGQPQLQAAAIIDAGGSLLVKRVVADDATLANKAILAKVKTVQVQKTNANGALLYTDITTGQETTVSTGNAPINIDVCSITYIQKSVEGAKDINAIYATIASQISETSSESTYPLFVITDNGRGKSNKRFNITPDYFASKGLDYTKYLFNILEGSALLESVSFSIDSDKIDNNLNVSLDTQLSKYSIQINGRTYSDNIKSFINKVAALSGNTVDSLLSNDILFAMNKIGSAKLSNIVIDNSFNLSYRDGIELENGDNGAFGDAPFGTVAYNTQVLNFFNGLYSDDIYDLDKYKIDIIADANYSSDIKRAIESYVTFREDGEYIGDLGLGLYSVDEWTDAHKSSTRNKFCWVTGLSYDIIDPFSKKQITVTATYTIAKKLVDHLNSRRNKPLAGIINNMILDDAIEGTVNFIPKITPTYNQKQILVDDRINYACYYDGDLVLDTTLTAQDQDTDFSYVQNVLMSQQVVKAVRTECPRIRYSFLTGADFAAYKEAVDKVINKFASNFDHAELVYLQDDTMVANKVFYAAIKFQFRPFVQAEYFKVYAIS